MRLSKLAFALCATSVMVIGAPRFAQAAPMTTAAALVVGAEISRSDAALIEKVWWHQHWWHQRPLPSTGPSVLTGRGVFG
jgi:hypothetical protein